MVDAGGMHAWRGSRDGVVRGSDGVLLVGNGFIGKHEGRKQGQGDVEDEKEEEKGKGGIVRGLVARWYGGG